MQSALANHRARHAVICSLNPELECRSTGRWVVCHVHGNLSMFSVGTTILFKYCVFDRSLPELVYIPQGVADKAPALDLPRVLEVDHEDIKREQDQFVERKPQDKPRVWIEFREHLLSLGQPELVATLEHNMMLAARSTPKISKSILQFAHCITSLDSLLSKPISTRSPLDCAGARAQLYLEVHLQHQVFHAGNNLLKELEQAIQPLRLARWPKMVLANLHHILMMTIILLGGFLERIDKTDLVRASFKADK